MGSMKGLSVPEAADKNMRILAVAVFLFAVKYAASAAALVVGAGPARVFDGIELGAALLGVLVLVPMGLWKFRKLSVSQRRLYTDPEGYVGEVFRRAGFKSWALTWILLVVMDILAREDITALPAEFFLQVVTAMTLGVFSVTFFYLNRGGAEDDGTTGLVA